MDRHGHESNPPWGSQSQGCPEELPYQQTPKGCCLDPKGCCLNPEGWLIDTPYHQLGHAEQTDLLVRILRTFVEPPMVRLRVCGTCGPSRCCLVPDAIIPGVSEGTMQRMDNDRQHGRGPAPLCGIGALGLPHHQ